MPKSWNNGVMLINWAIDRFLSDNAIDIAQFKVCDSLISYLYNLLLDHLHDPFGEQLEQCITALKQLNGIQ